jgi:hypothetical protein
MQQQLHVQLADCTVTLFSRPAEAVLQSYVALTTVTTKDLLTYCAVVFDALGAGAVLGTALLRHGEQLQGTQLQGIGKRKLFRSPLR